MEYEDLREDINQIVHTLDDIRSSMRRVVELLEQQSNLEESRLVDAAQKLLNRSKERMRE